MIKYIIVCPNSNVDLKNGTTGIDVLCSKLEDESLFWQDPRTPKQKLVMFDDRNAADAFIIQKALPVGAFSYGIER